MKCGERRSLIEYAQDPIRVTCWDRVDDLLNLASNSPARA